MGEVVFCDWRPWFERKRNHRESRLRVSSRSVGTSCGPGVRRSRDAHHPWFPSSHRCAASVIAPGQVMPDNHIDQAELIFEGDEAVYVSGMSPVRSWDMSNI